MRQINFLVIFVICLALLLFGIQNTEPAVVRITDSIEVSAPLAVILVVVLGIGAVLAWIFNVWNQVQLRLNLWSSNREVRRRDVQIERLQADLERYRVELEEQKLLPPSEGKGKKKDKAIQEAEITS